MNTKKATPLQAAGYGSIRTDGKRYGKSHGFLEKVAPRVDKTPRPWSKPTSLNRRQFYGTRRRARKQALWQF